MWQNSTARGKQTEKRNKNIVNFHFRIVIISCNSLTQSERARLTNKKMLLSFSHDRSSRFVHRLRNESCSREKENALLSLRTTSVSLALGTSVVGLVVHGALGVGAEVLESAVGGLLGLLGAVGYALVVGVGRGRAGLGFVLALGRGGLAALVGGGHDV
jgi:hypothetical protein